MADNFSISSCDITVIDKIKSKGMILDLTVRFEISSAQPENINDEKMKIYNPTVAYYKTKFTFKIIVKLWVYLLDPVEQFLNC